MYKVIEHNWEETSIVGRSGKTLCRFSIHDLGTVTEDNQDNLESVQQERVSMVLNSINSHTALVEALEHVEAMADDAYLLGHPEWAEIIAHVRKAKAQAKGGA